MRKILVASTILAPLALLAASSPPLSPPPQIGSGPPAAGSGSPTQTYIDSAAHAQWLNVGGVWKQVGLLNAPVAADIPPVVVPPVVVPPVVSPPAAALTVAAASSAVQGVAVPGVAIGNPPATYYAVLQTSGVDEGTRVASTGAAPQIAPVYIGTYIYAIYAAATGGSPLAVSPSFTVSAPPNALAYAGKLGSGGGANAPAAALPALPAGFFLADYSDDSAPGPFPQWNSWIGQGATKSPASIHTGQASEADFINSVDYVLGINNYSGTKLVSVPLVYSNGTAGGELAAAAAGSLNADYTTIANKLLTDLAGQATIIVRTGWEFNQNNGASAPWYSGNGNQQNYIGAYQQLVTTFRAARAAFISANPGKTVPQFLFGWCYNLTGDDPSQSYPGDGYVDFIEQDDYLFPAFGDSTDPDTAFQQLVNKPYGLNYVANFAATHNKPIAFPEFAVNLDNFGQFIKLMQAWISQHNVAYLTWWDNNGDYAGMISDGTYPETGAAVRHFFNPTQYSVEPIPAPGGAGVVVGNNLLTVSATALPSTIEATVYNLYEGSAAGAENLATPVATASSPSFQVAVPNGTTRYFKIAAGNGINVGFASAEVSGTAAAPAANAPAHTVAMGGNGQVTTPSLSLPNGGAFATDFVAKVTFSPTASDINPSNGNNGSGERPLLTLWGNTGYLQTLYLGLQANQPQFGIHNSSNGYNFVSAAGASFNAGQYYTLEVDYTYANGTAQFYLDPAGAGTRTPLGGPLQLNGGNPVTPSTAQRDPNQNLNPVMQLGGTTGGGDAAFTGAISSASYTVGGTPVVQPVATATAVTDASAGTPVWTVGGTATVH